MALVIISLIKAVLWIVIGLGHLGIVVRGEKEPRVYVHIGPSKTGTTYIQDLLGRIKDKLLANGVCWPADDHKGTYFHNLANALDTKDKKLIAHYRANIDACIAKKLTVIISSEHFHFMKDFDAFYEFFKPYNTYIIAYHREVTSWVYSAYTQQNKIKVDPEPFGEHMVRTLSSLTVTNNSGSRVSIRKFESMFGSDKMIFVDYDGAMGAGKDIAFVILCDILGIFCSELPKVRQSQANTRPEMVPFNVMTMLTHFVQVLGCRVCSKLEGKNMLEFVKRFDPLPAVKVDRTELPGLWELSDQEEASYTAEFGDRMLYTNQTATRLVARSFSVMELDQEEFYSSRENTRWLRRQVGSLYKEGYLCNCPQNFEKLLSILMTN